jgi:hypothetical protein
MKEPMTDRLLFVGPGETLWGMRVPAFAICLWLGKFDDIIRDGLEFKGRRV